ncbi:hypothetical protein FHR32_007730 [Streptosporangium album]|uniref:Uncharacterized protein n=1 Tax=Streptosporangium album TaxID=47479 RepID=A0A7W7S3N4_9ACTN|nr:hypothetical protein [Streptosporangium album]
MAALWRRSGRIQATALVDQAGELAVPRLVQVG